MSLFEMYLQLGFEHIVDFNGYDHILFVSTLCGVYLLSQWRSILVLITAFTIGHSITLALAALKIIVFSSAVIEFLIPVTIFLTCIANMLHKGNTISKQFHMIKYGATLFFGLIHGLGFSNYLIGMLGAESSIVMPLFAFNIGLEIGQLAIVIGILLMAWFFVNVLKAKRREWNLVISGAGAGISLVMLIERWSAF